MKRFIGVCCLVFILSNAGSSNSDMLFASEQFQNSANTSDSLENLTLLSRIDEVVAKVKKRQLKSDEHTPWVIMHAAIAFKSEATVFDVESQENIQAIEYLLTRAKHEGRPLFRLVKSTPRLPRVPEVEHHMNQYLMMLALARVSLKKQLILDTGDTLAVTDLVEAAKLGIDDEQEVGWSLVALSTYLSFADKWVAANGKSYQIKDILRLGISRDPRNEAEGGTHHLFGVAYAYNKYRHENDTLMGVWQEAGKYLKKHTMTVQSFQQEDGAFSDGLLSEAAAPESPSKLVFSTGHTLEWLIFALTDEELREPWVVRAVNRLCEEIENNPLEAFSDGGIYHAVNALRLYKAIALQ